MADEETNGAGPPDRQGPDASKNDHAKRYAGQGDLLLQDGMRNAGPSNAKEALKGSEDMVEWLPKSRLGSRMRTRDMRMKLRNMGNFNQVQERARDIDRADTKGR
jgi:hypothetical protein